MSAVVELAHQVLAATALADPARGTGITVGVVRGGSAVNVVPADAEAQVDLRYPTPGDGGLRPQKTSQSLSQNQSVTPGGGVWSGSALKK